MDQVAHPEQCGFIKGRSINDCIAVTQEVLSIVGNLRFQLSFSNWILRRHMTVLTGIVFLRLSKAKGSARDGYHG